MSYPNPKNIVHVTNSDISAGRIKHVTETEISIIQNFSGYRSGMTAISSGASSITVSGLNLGTIPTFINVTVIRPSAGSDLVFASVSMDAITTDGFTAEFSASVPSSGYYLSYILKV